MEEAQSILALGCRRDQQDLVSGGKQVERVANVSNYEIYIDRLDEMMERKKTVFEKIDGGKLC